MNPDPNPELAAPGGLVAALEQEAARLGLDLTVLPHSHEPRTSARIPSVVPERDPLGVHIVSGSRQFRVGGGSQGIGMVSGWATDLSDVVRAGAAWRRGASLREMKAEAPFLEYDGLAEAHERGPAAVVAHQWREMRRLAAKAPDFTAFAALVEAAHAEPRLRQLYVFSSHWTLGFSSCTGYPFRDEIAVAPPVKSEPYRVMRRPLRAALGEAATAEEAVALAVSHLRADIGPAVSGTARRD
ncbi:DUF6193 family natural product biosynthesis protein [Streptomyces sp. LaPpAH-108]|uniref:DUF6193 family natural product biosynthesis protein n=1 Tax=Streptomyces sp. LaPpAH-108 TaxID=1155714 RepID=UPI00035D5C95|nr:DUF6193 family natural product biosynthesis protein [Streptomyces sp. LaPpAH-108]